MKKAAIVLMVATIISKVLGLLRETVLAYFYGTSLTASVYGTAVSIPASIVAIIGAGIATGYIPMYSQIEKEHGIKRANIFTANMINFIMVITTIVVAIVLVFTPYVVTLFAYNFSGKELEMTVYLTRFTIIGIYFTIMVSIFTAYLNIKNKFLIPALVSLPMNIVIIASIAIAANMGITILGIGSIVSMAVQVIFLIPLMRKEGYKHKFILDKKDDYIKKVRALAIPVIIGVSALQVNGMVDKSVASTISDSAIAMLNYGVKLNGVIQGLFVMSIVTAMYPMISKMGVENNINGLKKSVGEAIISISLLVIPVSIGIMIFAEPGVRLLFERGEFTSKDTIIVSGVLFFYSIGMIGYALREVISKAFYSLQETKTPMKNAIVAIIVNIILTIVLTRFMGLNGIALATSIAGIFCTITLSLSLRKKIGALGLKSILLSLLKISVSSIIMGICAKIVFSYILESTGNTLSLILGVLVGVAVYGVLIYYMNIKEFRDILNMISSRFKPKKL